jgi:parvulin-like peptidyl-prolyl isomerase
MTIDSGHKPALHKKHVARLQREKQQSRIILYAFIGIVVVVLLLLAYGYYDINYLQRQRPVAKVGKYAILVNQFEPRVRMQRQQLLAQYSQYSQYGQMFGMDVKSQLDQIQSQLDAPETIGQSVLDQLINEQLVRLEAEKRGITVNDTELVEAKESAFSYYPNGTPTSAPTPTEVVMPKIPAEAFKVVTITPTPTAIAESTATTTPAVAATATFAPEATATTAATVAPEPTATPYTQSGFENRFSESQKAMMKLGLSEKDYLALFDTQILQTKVQEAITADVPHTEKQVWARHILLSDEATAIAVLEKLKKGEDFAALAAEFSQDTGSAVNGGDLGWFGTGAMVPEFETAAFALEKPGDYTATPVQSQFGYHIIQLIATQDRPLSAEQYDTAKNKAFTDWLAAAREEYGVETFDLWKQYVPSDPNFVTIATDSAIAQKTALAGVTQESTATTAP